MSFHCAPNRKNQNYRRRMKKIRERNREAYRKASIATTLELQMRAPLLFEAIVKMLSDKKDIL